MIQTLARLVFCLSCWLVSVNGKIGLYRGRTNVIQLKNVTMDTLKSSSYPNISTFGQNYVQSFDWILEIEGIELNFWSLVSFRIWILQFYPKKQRLDIG